MISIQTLIHPDFCQLTVNEKEILRYLGVKEDDLVKLEPILASNVFDKPTIKLSIYKNRRGRYKGVFLWCKADLGCCRIKPMFCTTYDYELVPIDDIKINFADESAFECDD